MKPISKSYILTATLCLSYVMTCHAVSDKAYDRDRSSATQYGPGWVIKSVLDTDNKSKINASAQMYNDMERMRSSAMSKGDNSNDETSLNLKKRKSTEGRTEGKEVTYNTIVKEPIDNTIPESGLMVCVGFNDPNGVAQSFQTIQGAD